MNCTIAPSSVTFQDITALVAAVGSVIATTLLFLQFYIDHHRSVSAGKPTPGGILVATMSGGLLEDEGRAGGSQSEGGGAEPGGGAAR